jgi:predicted signal transduction protein with EAL and GGDEF domain
MTAGKHEFDVAAVDRQGNREATPAHFRFTVAAPWYRTGGFLAILSAGLVVITCLAWFAVRKVAQLKTMATRDSLTSHWNRRAIFQLLGNELARSKREARSVAVIMADLDEFKSVNDRYGHLVGHVVLRETASRLRSSMASRPKSRGNGGI